MKEKRFFRNFTMIFFVLLAVVILMVGIAYMMSVNALEKEIRNIYQNSTYDLQVRVEEILQQCNLMSSSLVIDDTVQLFYSHAAPESLISGYYSIIKTKLNSHAVPYIDSIILYAPKFDRMISSQSADKSYDMESALNEWPAADVSWLETVETQESTSTAIVVRAKNHIWPYYLSIIKNWSKGGVEGAAVLNINLAKLHDHLVSENNRLTQVYIVDSDQQVVLQNDKQALTVPVSDVEALNAYRSGTSFSEIQTAGDNRYVYAQAYSEEYGLTCITVTQINEHYGQLKDVQEIIILVFLIAFFVTFAIAIIYSYRLVKPLKDIQKLMDSPLTLGHDHKQYDENIRDIAEQLISHLQTNNRLRQELDSRLDLLNDTKILALQAQINPHFLFNTLNAIRLTVENDCGNSHPGVLMLDELSFVLRYSLSDINVVSIRDELEFTKEYIAIMDHRYGEIDTQIDAEEGVFRCAIPKLVLQPLVENSIQHGLAPCIGMKKTELKISVKKIHYQYPNGTECPSVCIEIADNGIGMGEDTLEKLRKSISDYNKISREHIGLTNVSHRFYLMFHNEQDIQVESFSGKGTTVRIFFPANELEDL